MRHRKLRSKLSMMTARRDATVRNMVKSLFTHQRIKMIKARAKVARRMAEHLITIAKVDTVASRRRAYMFLNDRDMVGRLFKEIVPLFKNRQSGYTRIIPLGFRRGDGAELCYLELTEKKIVEKLPKKKKEKAKEEPAEEKKEEKKEHKEEPKAKHISKAKLTPQEEKEKQKAKSEVKKISDSKQGFMKNLRGLFRKRGDF